MTRSLTKAVRAWFLTLLASLRLRGPLRALLLRMVIGICALVLLVGLLMYALSAQPKLQEIGRIMFAFGLLALLLNGDKVVAVLR